jgi:hypothetical protein
LNNAELPGRSPSNRPAPAATDRQGFWTDAHRRQRLQEAYLGAATPGAALRDADIYELPAMIRLLSVLSIKRPNAASRPATSTFALKVTIYLRAASTSAATR